MAISLKNHDDRITALEKKIVSAGGFTSGSGSDSYWIKNNSTGKYTIFIPNVSFNQDQNKIVNLPFTLSSNKYIAIAQHHLDIHGGQTNQTPTSSYTTSSFRCAYVGYKTSISFIIMEY